MRTLSAIGALAIVVAVAAAVFFFGGFYSVAGTTEEPGIVKWGLTQVRMASVKHHADDSPPTTFNNTTNVQAGAREFARLGCANCHGAPGVDWAKFAEGLRPDPPDLKDIVNDRTPSQLFWIVKNGIKMTGMPSFSLAGAKDDAIWSIVAFLKKLPTISETEYKAWTAPSAGTDAPPPQNR
jgi:mono/diheme cytochrome c family protein